MRGGCLHGGRMRNHVEAVSGQLPGGMRVLSSDRDSNVAAYLATVLCTLEYGYSLV